MSESDGAWGDLAESNDELAEVWDGFARLPEPGENDALDAFAARKRIDLSSLARLGARLATPTTLAFAFSGGIKFREIETGRRWTYAGSEFPRMKIVRTGGGDSDTVIVAEGETDGARLSILYPEADIAVLPRGAKSFPPEYAEQVQGYAVVLAAYDNDEAGTEGLQKLIAHVPHALPWPAPANPDNDWCGAQLATVPPLPAAEDTVSPFKVGGLVFQDFGEKFALALAGKLPPPKLIVDDMVYETGVHWLSGHPASGKSIIALAWAQLIMNEGRHVVWADYEMGLEMHVRRMAEVGYTLDLSLERFHYAWYPPDLVKHLGHVAERWPKPLVVIDSASKALSMAGINEDNPSEVTGWTVPLIQAAKTYDLPMVVIDHVTKSDKGDSRYARGAGAKLADTDVNYKLTVLDPFTRDHAGMVELRQTKDRFGYVPVAQWLKIGDGNGRLPVVPCDGPEDPDSDEPSL